MADVFLSYTRADASEARRLAEALESRGWSVWWDRRIPHGKDFNSIIQQELDDARCILVLWSAASVSSHFVRDEATEGNNGRLVPVLIEAVKQPLGFRQLQAADLSDWRGLPTHEEFQRLVRSINDIVPPSSAATQVQLPAASDPDSPAPTAFVIYFAEDREPVEALLKELESRGIKIWQDRQAVRAGDNWNFVAPKVINDYVDYAIVVQTPSMATRTQGVFYADIRLALGTTDADE